MLIFDWLRYPDGLDIGTDDGNALWLWYGKPLGKALGDMYGLSLGTYDGTVIRSLEV